MRRSIAALVGWCAVASGCADVDGWVDAGDVCRATYDVADQPAVLRPTGGEISVPWGLTPEQERAVLDAAEARVWATDGAAGWAVHVGGPEAFRKGESGVLLAQCERGDLELADRRGEGAWTMTKPATGVAIVWDHYEPSGWAPAIAAQLAALEGRSP